MAENTEQTVDQSQNGLLDFNWDDSTDSFFGLNDQGDEPQPVEKPKTPEATKVDDAPTDDKPEESKDKNKTKEDETVSFFEEGEEDEKSKGGESENSNFYTDVYKDLKESGIFKHVEIDEDEELDADRLYELQQEEIEAEVGARLQSWANEDLDEDGMPDALEVAKFGVDAEIKQRKMDLDEQKLEQQKKEHEDKKVLEEKKIKSQMVKKINSNK